MLYRIRGDNNVALELSIIIRIVKCKYVRLVIMRKVLIVVIFYSIIRTKQKTNYRTI